jgi:predicted aspartyl protease
VDSGSTDTFVPLEIAEILDLIPASHDRGETDVHTAGGSFRFYRVKLKNLSLLSGGSIFSEFSNLKVLVPQEMERDLPYSILGRNSIFRRFHITFVEKEHRFVLDHHKWARQRAQAWSNRTLLDRRSG